ncbi:hypothetical protein BA895_16355 [Humibacillus sp. DSM 29435]|uniref:DUF2695 domain-containing protein n=1 Tax=Humibacillus sp. DSM 29435 TaxID=1869167 RepID=UPI000871ECF6|nr:DUF2695 domain-containing protein [Humibacillus sp. DSM 29435]OFE17358.1 hypothetical protein BA895_16355 [Humibacillus sp. DSM 29435]
MSNVVHILTRRPLDERLGTSVRPGECLVCFLRRMVGAQACLGSFTWAEHYRLSRAPRAVALERRLRAEGATCDCEVPGRVWRLNGSLLVRDPASGALVEPDEPPRCSASRPTSTKPCDNWGLVRDLAL